MKLYFKTNERLKKIFNYFSIFTIVLGTTFGSINSVNAEDVTGEGATLVAGDLTTDDRVVIDADGDAVIDGINGGSIEISGIANSAANNLVTLDLVDLTVSGDITTTGYDLNIDVIDGSALTIGGNVLEDAAGSDITIDLLAGDTDGESSTLTLNGTNVDSAIAVIAATAGDGAVTFSGTTIRQTGTIGTTSAEVGSLTVSGTTTLAAGFNAETVVISADTTIGANSVFNTMAISGGSTVTIDGSTGEATASAGSTISLASASDTLVFSNNSTFATSVTSSSGVGIVTFDTDSGDMNGTIGASGAAVDTLNVDGNTAFSGSIYSDDIKIKTAKTMTIDGAAAVTISGPIDGDAQDKGTLVVNNTTGTEAIFASAVGADYDLLLITHTEGATYQSSVAAKGITVADAKIVEVAGNLTIGATTATLDATSELVLNGTSAQTVSGSITGAAATEGIIKVSNASTSGASFSNAIGTDDKEIDDLDIQGSSSKAVLTANTNYIDELKIASGGILEIATTAYSADNDIIIRAASDHTAASINTEGKIIMPVNLKEAGYVRLLKDISTTDIDATTGAVADVNAVLQDTALVNYVASKNDTDDIRVTATEKTDAVTSSELSVTLNNAKALRELRDAAVAGNSADSSAQTALGNALNATGGYGATEDTSLAVQAAPQDDMISGSTFATKAMTGSLQGIMSNRMAALRSGDAFYGSGVAAGAMSANSGFLQVFGTQAEQDNKTVGSGTQYGFDSSSAGVALGFDGITDNGSVVGLSLSMSETDVDGKGTGNSKNDIDSYTASIYMDKSTDAGYVEGSLTVGLNENNSSRIVNTAGLDRTYKGNYDSEQVSLKIGGGIPNDTGNGYLTPFGSITATRISTDAYTESSTTANDSLRLRVAQDDVDSIVGTVGLKYHNVLDNGGSPMISLAINNEFGDSTINSTNTYQGGGSSFKTSTDVEELSATLGLGYSISSDNGSIEFAYEADANDDDYLSHYGSIKLVGKF